MRKRGVLFVLAALVAGAAAMAWFVLRDRAPGRPAQAAAAADDPWNTTTSARPRPASAQPSRQGELPALSFEADPDGPLRLEGQILDERDQPVAGAIVRISTSPARTVKSDADGSFAIDKLLGRTYTVIARDGDRVGGPVRTRVAADGEPLVIRMRLGVTLTVEVTDAASGAPLPGATVELADGAAATQMTDARGRAVFRGLDDGWTSVIATARGYGAATSMRTVGRGDRDAKVGIALRAGAPLRGKVIDEAGRGVANARVWPVDAASRFGSRALERTAVTTAADGAFTIPALAGGSYVLRAEHEEHAPVASAPVTVGGETEVTGVELVMPGATSLAGVVVDTEGQPVPYATVRLSSSEWSTDMINRQAAADPQGTFVLRALPRSRFKLRAESEEAASQVVDADLTGAGAPAPVQLVLDQTGLVAGVVVDGAGEPVAEAEVSAMPDFLADGAAMKDFMLVQRAATTTDGGGRFALRGLASGPYRLYAARSTGGRTAQVRRDGVAARTGDREVRIVLPSPGGVKGTIELPDGKAPTLAMVSLGDPYRMTVSDGTFTLDDVPPGRYDVRVSGMNFATRVVRGVEIEAGAITDAGTIVVRPGRVIRGRVVDAGGAPVEGARVLFGKILIGDGSQIGGGDDDAVARMGMRSALTDREGRFVLAGISRGGGSLLASHPERGRSLPVRLPASDGDVEVPDMALKAYGAIAGRVTRKGQPVAGATITASPLGTGGQAIFVSAGDDGTFVIDKAPEGPTHLTAMKTSIMSFEGAGRTVTVKAGERVDGSIEVPAGDVTLTVEVQPEPGERVDFALVFLFRGEVRLPTAQAVLDDFYAKHGTRAENGATEIDMTGPAAWVVWLGGASPAPRFKELAPGTYSACVVPMTGALPGILEQAMNHLDLLESVCQAATLPAMPRSQTLTVTVPTMRPLPEEDE